jgi:hypothetical protein
MTNNARLAILKTWQPEGRIERIVETRQIPFTGTRRVSFGARHSWFRNGDRGG